MELRGPLSAVWKTAIAFPNQPNSKPTIPNQTIQCQPNQPPAGPAPHVFFSSRRRHTRCLSDWSSDVCSSDLFAEIGGGHTILGHARVFHYRQGRSEERRVGEEGRSRWSPHHYKQQHARPS